jgi:hypothetical protein
LRDADLLLGSSARTAWAGVGWAVSLLVESNRIELGSLVYGSVLLLLTPIKYQIGPATWIHAMSRCATYTTGSSHGNGYDGCQQQGSDKQTRHVGWDDVVATRREGRRMVGRFQVVKQSCAALPYCGELSESCLYSVEF